MLKRSNKILIGCLALLLVLSVGYALFSDTITINGTATAKGEFKLTTTCDDIIIENGFASNKGSVTDAVITCEDNIVNASATLGYPGSRKWFRVMVTNTGTIPAKLKQVVELNNPEHFIVSKEENTYMIENNATNSDKTNSAIAALYPGPNFWDDYEATEEDWKGYLDYLWPDEQFDAVLDPGETAYFYIEMMWYSGSTTPGDPLTPTLNAEITWEQVTE